MNQDSFPFLTRFQVTWRVTSHSPPGADVAHSGPWRAWEKGEGCVLGNKVLTGPCPAPKETCPAVARTGRLDISSYA